MFFKYGFAATKALYRVMALSLLMWSDLSVQADDSTNDAALVLKQQIASAESYRDAGNYSIAEQQLNSVLSHAAQLGDRLTQAMAAGALGYSFYLRRNDAQAQTMLLEALHLAESMTHPALTALIENYLGLMQLALEKPEQAKPYFEKALLNARLAHDTGLELAVLLNQAKLESEVAARVVQLQNLSAMVLQLPDTALKGNLLANLAEQLFAVAELNYPIYQQQELLQISYQVLNADLHLAEGLQQTRLKALVLGYLGRLYRQQNLAQDALSWYEQAVFAAQQANAKDLLMQFEGQRAAILQQTGQTAAALAAYRRAALQLNDIRHDIPVYLHNGQSSIQQLVDPTYRGLADVLLAQAQQVLSSQGKQSLLNEAIAAMEASKQAELEDYFRDRCLLDDVTEVNLLTQRLPGVAIIYPIIFADRVELLFRAGDSEQIQQKTIPIAKDRIQASALQITERLRDGKDYRLAAHQLYDWLIRPFQTELTIKTLIYIPDGILRQVPVAALHDGKHFVVEHFASVTLPGLSLEKNVLSPERKDRNALIAGLSKPDGPSLDQLAPNFVKNVLGEPPLPSSDADSLAAASASKQQTDDNRADLVTELSLPGINREVAMLQKKLTNTTLLNKAFTYREFQQSISSGAYSIVHIASHGYFGKRAEDSFIMAYDQNFKLNDFQTLLNSGNSKQSPIDIITLNACETADGDDHALLGFSGIAIKTNTLSAVGTLWPINDAAAVKFMAAFYERLEGGVDSKAEALRQAQLTLFNDKKFKHPYYWSPFILVGDWQ
ncbi:MAG: CHAT domain-containing protein [Methylococcales bacterium]